MPIVHFVDAFSGFIHASWSLLPLFLPQVHIVAPFSVGNGLKRFSSLILHRKTPIISSPDEPVGSTHLSNELQRIKSTISVHDGGFLREAAS